MRPQTWLIEVLGEKGNLPNILALVQEPRYQLEYKTKAAEKNGYNTHYTKILFDNQELPLKNIVTL